MADAPNLWPKEFKVNVQSPVSILKAQANLLGQVTRSVLQATVETESSEKSIQHRFVIIAPAYNQYRHVLLTARHGPHLPYPTTVINESVAKIVKREATSLEAMATIFSPVYDTVYPEAFSDDELIGVLQTVLRSESTRAVILSLLAKSNDTAAAKAEAQASGPFES